MECSLCDNQGWFLSNDADWNDEIQKCDTCNVFKSDKEAQEFERKEEKIIDYHKAWTETIRENNGGIEDFLKKVKEPLDTVIAIYDENGVVEVYNTNRYIYLNLNEDIND
jgi:hypothetical protein